MKPLCTILFATIALLMASSASAQDAAQALNALIEEEWEHRLQENPLFATAVGDHRFNDRLPSMSVDAHDARHERTVSILERLQAIDRDALTRDEVINYDMFARMLRDRVAEYEYETHLMPITGLSGFHIQFAQLSDRAPLNTLDDYANYVTRLEAFGRFVDEHLELMRIGLRNGRVLPRVTMEGWEDTIDPHIVDDPTESLLYRAFEDYDGTLPEAEWDRLERRGRAAIAETVVPAYRVLRRFIAEEYLPGMRSTFGASDLPDGRAFYEHRVRRYTTLDVTPQQLHDTGLEEVARIRDEMQEVIDELEFAGEFIEFVEFLRSDPQFYANTADELMKEVAYVLKKMDGELPRLFKKLPRAPYGIKPVPDFIAPKTTTAYYNRPAGDGTRAGFYYVNCYDLRSRPLYEIEALSLHEAVPGHHLQVALSQELEGIPNFRRFGFFTVFGEGWALYAERLGLEAGFYQDPYSNFGRLTYEMWRACRLVVDTGLHYFGWDRQRAIDFMAENSALSIHNITKEVDRYISWPGQALAYKTGELKIRELRTVAEDTLGDAFDVREFHDVVLGSGSVPLDILEANVNAWIERSR